MQIDKLKIKQLFNRDTSNELVLKVKSLLYYKDYINVSVPKNNEYLKQEAVKNNSIVDIVDNNIIVDVDGRESKIYRYQFCAPLGIDKTVDGQIKEDLINVLNLMESDIKIYHLLCRKNLLEKNIESLYKSRDKASSEILEVYNNRIHMMEVFNKMEYITIYLSVNINNYQFKENVKDIIKLEQVVDEELIQFIYALNNGFVL